MNVYRKYKVIKRVEENDLVVSLYLASADNLPLKTFLPGQHLLFKISVPGHEIPVFRYYSFSDVFNQHYYRISIKKEPAPKNDFSLPPGLASYYLYDCIKEGDLLEAKGPAGDFQIHTEDNKPVVLIAGGIGITPLLSMIKSIAKINPQRRVYFFYGVNESNDHSFQNELHEIAMAHSNFFVTTFYNKVKPGDVKGLHYHHKGFINIAIILQVIKEIHLDYYICGPGPMMHYVTDELEKLGVNKENVHIESFSIDATQNLEDVALEPLPKLDKINDDIFSIEFLQAGKKLLWDKRYKSILEFAEGNDIDINSGCLFGDCGTCLTEIKEGNVHYTHQTLVKVENGKCLPCSCVPASNVVLNV